MPSRIALSGSALGAPIQVSVTSAWTVIHTAAVSADYHDVVRLRILRSDGDAKVEFQWGSLDGALSGLGLEVSSMLEFPVREGGVLRMRYEGGTSCWVTGDVERFDVNEASLTATEITALADAINNLADSIGLL